MLVGRSDGKERSEIAFFDVETTFPSRRGQGRAILEFGAILVCPNRLVELHSYTALVRPYDLSHIASLSRSNGITKDAVLSAKNFSEIADVVYDLLHGRIWAGHNILMFDCARIREAFAEIHRPAPEPKGTIDSLVLLTQKFGRRAGDMKMETLATYCGLGRQTHRSLPDVRMNLEVLKHCAAILFLESNLPDILTPNAGPFDMAILGNDFLEPRDVSIPSIEATLVPFYRGTQKIRMLHRNLPLQLRCDQLKVRFGINAKFLDYAGRPRLSIVVYLPRDLCAVLDAVDELARKRSIDCGSSSEWWPIVMRNKYFPTTRLHILTSDETRMAAEIFCADGSQRLEFSESNVAQLESLFAPGDFVDACISFDAYDYMQNAGIRVVARKLIVHS